jgi:hypothetical protein
MIYLAAWGDLVKIGSARDPEARVRQLPYGGPDTPRLPGRPRLLGWVNGDLAGERLLQAALAEHRVVGEWYRADAPAVRAVVEQLAHPRRLNRPTIAS